MLIFPGVYEVEQRVYPCKMVGKEDDPFLLGFGNFLGENSLLNFRRLAIFIKDDETTICQVAAACFFDALK